MSRKLAEKKRFLNDRADDEGECQEQNENSELKNNASAQESFVLSVSCASQIPTPIPMHSCTYRANDSSTRRLHHLENISSYRENAMLALHEESAALAATSPAVGGNLSVRRGGQVAPASVGGHGGTSARSCLRDEFEKFGSKVKTSRENTSTRATNTLATELGMKN